MALTRGTTGHAAPRNRYIPEILQSKPKTKKTTTASTKAGTSKPRVTKVEKKKVPATHHKRKPHLGDKVKGVLEKAVGSVERKPGKKAAGTKKIRGTDGKGGHTTVTKKV